MHGTLLDIIRIIEKNKLIYYEYNNEIASGFVCMRVGELNNTIIVSC